MAEPWGSLSQLIKADGGGFEGLGYPVETVWSRAKMPRTLIDFINEDNYCWYPSMKFKKKEDSKRKSHSNLTYQFTT